MSPVRPVLEPAFVLHARPYRETSLLLEVFSRGFGRTGLVARGARGRQSQRRALLQPFRPLLLSWRQRGDLGTLTSVEPAGAAGLPGGRVLFAAFYMNELLLRLLQRGEPHPELFDAYVEALSGLAGQAKVAPALRCFEKRVLEGLGYGLLLDQEAGSGRPVVADVTYRYHLEYGPERCGPDATGELVLRGTSLLALHREELDDAPALADARRLLRAALSLYLGRRGLRTREVLQDLERLLGQAGD